MPTTKVNDQLYESTFYEQNADGSKVMLVLQHSLDGRIHSRSSKVVQPDEKPSKNLPPKGSDVYKFFVTSLKADGSPLIPCFFEGCEELRAAYAKELAILEEDVRQGRCKACDRHKLMQQYIPKIQALMTESKATNA